MIKSVAITAATWFLVLFTYTVIAAGTARFHEQIFPGPTNSNDNNSPVVGVVWPIGLPITTAIYVSNRVF